MIKATFEEKLGKKFHCYAVPTDSYSKYAKYSFYEYVAEGKNADVSLFVIMKDSGQFVILDRVVKLHETTEDDSVDLAAPRKWADDLVSKIASENKDIIKAY